MPTLLALVEGQTAGDPMGGAKWLNCRLRDVRDRLTIAGHTVSCPVISRLLQTAGYRLRQNVKQREGTAHPDRGQQFEHIRWQRAQHQQAGQPTVSVDTKKKELIGDFKNGGRVWCRQAEAVNMHDFLSQGEGRAVPYGIYDPHHNRGVVYVGQSADTPAFAVDNLLHWCQTELPRSFPDATHLFIEADGGGSNSARSRVWKHQLQEKLADGLGLTVTVCHYPPGTSKWNPIEHRLFSEMSKTWAGCPLRSFAVILDLIEQTTTATGLTVRAHRVMHNYPTGVTVSTADMATLNIQPHDVCPQWNYTIRPRTVA